MAGIDKTYTDSWKEYQELIIWAKNTSFKCPNGIILNPINSIYYWNKESFDGKELPVMNTSSSLDYFLIKECPIQFVQNRMREVYPKEFIQSILDGTSIFDTFKRPNPGSKLKITRGKNMISKNYLWKIKSYNPKFSIYCHDQDGNTMWYNEQIDNWLYVHELGEWDSNGIYFGKSVKALIRKIRKWNLPKGCKIQAFGRYIDEYINIEIL